MENLGLGLTLLNFFIFFEIKLKIRDCFEIFPKMRAGRKSGQLFNPTRCNYCFPRKKNKNIVKRERVRGLWIWLIFCEVGVGIFVPREFEEDTDFKTKCKNKFPPPSPFPFNYRHCFIFFSLSLLVRPPQHSHPKIPREKIKHSRSVFIPFFLPFLLMYVVASAMHF